MKRGAVVLTPFPFTDLTGHKVRPALVVSRSDRAGPDVLLAFITSRLNLSPSPADLSLDSAHPDFTPDGFEGRLKSEAGQVGDSGAVYHPW